MKRQEDEELEGAPPARRRPIDSLEPEPEQELDEQSRGPRTPPEEPPREDPANPEEPTGEPMNLEEQPGPSTSGAEPVEQLGRHLNSEEQPREDLVNPEDQPREPQYPEEQPGPSTLAEPVAEGPVILEDQPEEYMQFEPREEVPLTLEQMIEQERLRCLERQIRRSSPFRQRQWRQGEGPPDPVPESWENSPEADEVFGNSAEDFFPFQIQRMKREKLDEIQKIKIHAMKLKPDPTSTVVIPRIFVYILHADDVQDHINYRPTEDRRHCMVKRRGNDDEMLLENQNYQDALFDHLFYFFMACGDLCATINKIEFVVDSNPLIPSNRLCWRTNGPGDSFLEQFRSLCREVDHDTLIIKTIEIENRYRPLKEAFEMAQYAPCVNVHIRPLKFEKENVDEVMETLGVFGCAALVNHWHIETSEPIENNIRNRLRVPNFTVYSPSPMEIIFNQDHPTRQRTARPT